MIKKQFFPFATHQRIMWEPMNAKRTRHPKQMISPRDAIDSFLVGTASFLSREIQKCNFMEQLFCMYIILNIVHHVVSSVETHDYTLHMSTTYNSTILVGWFLSAAILCRKILQFHLHASEMKKSSSSKSCCTIDTMSSDVSTDAIYTRCINTYSLETNVEGCLIQIPGENSDWGYFADWKEDNNIETDSANVPITSLSRL